jgi:superfamily II DNA or RNA helicase
VKNLADETLGTSFPKVDFAFSGAGNHITQNITKPLLESSTNYDRVTGFFSPTALKYLIEEFASVWKSGGTIRLIMGFHDQYRVFDEKIRAASNIKRAVSLALEGEIEEISKHLNNQQKEVIAELSSQRALQVRLAIPTKKYERVKKNGKWDNHGPVFHSKFAVFHSRNKKNKSRLVNWFKTRFRGKPRAISSMKTAKMRLASGDSFVVVTGSQNDSHTAFSDNVEDAIVHRSSDKEGKKYASYFVNRFEDLWWAHEELDEVVLVPFDSEFLEFMTESSKTDSNDSEQNTGDPEDTGDQNIPVLTWEKFYQNVSTSRIYHSYLLPNVGLLPHQMSVYQDILSRWPIRGIIADEVGLGKTIEAGSIIDYCLTHLNFDRVCVLTPASLQGQWQSEMETLFELDFSITDSRNVDSDGIFAASAPVRQIISWHWIRSFSVDEIGNNLPDLLIVDEAHNARGSTQFAKFMRDIKDLIPHVVLLTATPYQTQLQDMQDLLDIVGVPKSCSISTLEYHTNFVAKRIREHMNETLPHVKQIHGSLTHFAPMPLIDSVPLLRKLHKLQYNENQKVGWYLKKEIISIPYEIAINCHPVNFLMSRNTRESLKESGYQFPESKLHGPNVTLSEAQSKWFNKLEIYLSDYYLLVEKEVGKQPPLGFNQNNFRLRWVSSINAAIESLQNREKGLENWKALNVGDKIPNTDKLITATHLISINAKVEEEINHIFEVRRGLQLAFEEQKILRDPKLEQLKKEVEKYRGKECKILIFSKFVDTCTAIMDLLQPLSIKHTIGRFHGGKDGMGIYDYSTKSVQPKNKSEMKEAHKKGDIDILICSDMASEGLNLQTASVVINVDVPYNPAVLMQRFGRVDRLGQQSDEVNLVNLYYPGSVEDRIFGALSRRWDELVAITGAAPRILDAISDNSTRAQFDLAIPIDLIINEAIENSSTSPISSVPFDRIIPMNDFLNSSPKKWFIEEIGKLLEEYGQPILSTQHHISDGDEIYSWVPTDVDYLQWGSSTMCELLQWITPPGLCDSSESLEIFQVTTENAQNLVLIGKYEGEYLPLPLEMWPGIFRFMIRGKPMEINIEKMTWREAAIITIETDLFIDFNAMKTHTQTDIELPDSGGMKLGDSLGNISITPIPIPIDSEEE